MIQPEIYNQNPSVQASKIFAVIVDLQFQIWQSEAIASETRRALKHSRCHTEDLRGAGAEKNMNALTDQVTGMS